MVCLETSFLIDLLRGIEHAVKRMNDLEQTSESITITAPSIVELATGAALAQSPRERELLQELISTVSVLTLDKESALLAGEVNAKLINEGQQIGAFDILIGCIAVANNEILLTRNLKHFEQIPGLRVEKY